MAENNECTHDCSTCGADCSSRKSGIPKEQLNPMSSVKKVIGVVSGKGGVGKSIVTSMMAVEMSRRDYTVGILDAAIECKANEISREEFKKEVQERKARERDER